MKTMTKMVKLLSVVLVLVLASNITSAQSNTIERRVASSTDDAEEQGANGANPGEIDITSSDLELVTDGGDGDQYVGIRFVDMYIPKGAVITEAYIQFDVDETGSDPVSVTVHGEAADNSSTFSATNFNISNRSTTAASVSWASIPAWNSTHLQGLDQRTPNIKTIVQEIIEREGWTPGNPVTFILTGTGTRTAEAYDGGTEGQRPKLVVKYTFPSIIESRVNSTNDDVEECVGSGSMDMASSDMELINDGCDQYVGLRFTGINIPSGTVITKAYIQFTVDELNSGSTSITLKGEAADNSNTFSSSAFSVSSRPTTTASVDWNNIPAWTSTGEAGPDQRTPDISSIITEIINRSGWSSGNALSIIITGSGERTAEAYDGEAPKAANLVIEYENAAVTPPAVENFPIRRNSVWQYNDGGIGLGTTWKDVSYPSADNWNYGAGKFGYGDNNEAITLNYGNDANNKYPTYYFRKEFNVANPSIFQSLQLNLLHDDGAIVYLNGVEVARVNMPAGTVNYSTYASSTIGGEDETTYVPINIPNTLVAGKNVIAVELHQADGSSSDLGFDAELIGVYPALPTTDFPVNTQSTWSYLDNGTNPGDDWNKLNFNDASWANGTGVFGFGQSFINTELYSGRFASNKNITYYFRKKVNVLNYAALPDILLLEVARDDGAVIYINGKILKVENMPSLFGHNTTAASENSDNKYFQYLVPKELLVEGENIIAVSVHLSDATDNDMFFDLSLTDNAPTVDLNGGCLGPDDLHFSCFKSLQPRSQNATMEIPSSHAFQVLLTQGDNYTENTPNVPWTNAPGNNDFTGFVARPGNPHSGWVAVNHENSPGGVTVIDVTYDPATAIFKVNSTKAVDFYNNDLVSTQRNCSGGVTPWGTIITSEESTPGGDANGDGYEDIGWNVEIDPATARVKEYGNGKQEKLWKLGRMSHENVVVSQDSMTVYEGEDAGSGCVYKFVADEKMNLSEGKLYVLVLDGPIVNGEPTVTSGKWVQVPNSTPADCNNTRSLAIALGGTPLNGVEDVEIGPDGKIYFTSKGYNRVYSFKDDGETLSEFKTFVGGKSYFINVDGDLKSEEWASGNDNLVFDDRGNLYVLQDGSRNHLWMVRPEHTQEDPRVELFMLTPAGSEPCGMTFSPDYKFAFVSMQHPSSANGSVIQIDAADKEAPMNKSVTVVVARKELLGVKAPTTVTQGFDDEFKNCGRVDLSWDNGNGNRRLVVARTSSAAAKAPANGTNYTANSEFKLGTDLGSGNYVVYNGTGNEVSVTGLTHKTGYVFTVYEYNGAEFAVQYQTTGVPAVNVTTDEVVTTKIIGSGEFKPFTVINYSVGLTEGSTYTWEVTGGNVVSGQGTNFVGVQWDNVTTGTIKVLETTKDGCAGEQKTYTVELSKVGIDEVDKASFKLYPNPAQNNVWIEVNETIKGDYAVTVIDLSGKVVLTANGTSSTKTQLDINALQAGTYIVKVSAGNKVSQSKLVIF